MSFSLIPDEKGDGAGEQWESVRRVYDPRGELDIRDGASSCAPSEWSAMSEIGSEIDGKMAEITDFDDRSSVASNDEQDSGKMPNVTGEEANTVASGAADPKTEDEDAARKSVDVDTRKVSQLELKVSGNDGLSKDDIRLDNITSPKRPFVYAAFDIDIDEAAPLETAAETERTGDHLPSKEATSVQTTLGEYPTEDDGLSAEMDKISSMKSSQV